ncbi:hypothetical protein HHI36_013183 [Cryptolaemus montrouzieri]|uniref:Uncharacterized protein n=1 Tax=Cryptolaemus montrouzieri TaxID=559131 RepID=A0ABD2NHJ9_9CUCU
MLNSEKILYEFLIMTTLNISYEKIWDQNNSAFSYKSKDEKRMSRINYNNTFFNVHEISLITEATTKYTRYIANRTLNVTRDHRALASFSKFTLFTYGFW